MKTPMRHKSRLSGSKATWKANRRWLKNSIISNSPKTLGQLDFQGGEKGIGQKSREPGENQSRFPFLGFDEGENEGQEEKGGDYKSKGFHCGRICEEGGKGNLYKERWPTSSEDPAYFQSGLETNEDDPDVDVSHVADFAAAYADQNRAPDRAELARVCGVSPDRMHLAHGSAATVICDTAERIGADLTLSVYRMQ